MSAGRRRPTRVAPLTWLYAYVGKRLISPRLPQPKRAFTQREVGEPEVVQVWTRHGPVRCLVYRAHPDAPLAATNRPPAYVNIHGGGFILTNPRQDDYLVNFLAAEVGVTVINVDYSTAPEVRYPVAEEQVYDVLAWVARSGNEMGWDDTRLSIGGGSAGAKLALSALHLAHHAGGPTVRAAITVVPLVDATLPPADYTSDLAKPAIGRGTIRLVQGTYFVDVDRRSEPLASPALDPTLPEALPPLLMLAGGSDTLAPQGRRFVEKLNSLGVAVTYREFEGMDHTFIAVDTTPPAVIDESLQLIKDHLLEHLGPTPDRQQR